MTSWVRKLIGVTAMAVLVASFAFAGVAAAGIMVEPGEGAPPDPGCSFTIGGLDANGQAPEGATSVSITVTGTIGGDPTGVIVDLLVGGVVVESQAAAANGSFFFGPRTVPVPTDVSISYSYGNENAYTNFCIGPGGQSVVRVNPAQVTRVPAARALAFTGSDDTTRNVLIGVAAIVLGTLLVVGTRRRSRVKG